MSSLSSDMVRIYLQEIGKYPLLKPDEEIAYGKQVQQMIAIEQSKNELTQHLDREPTMRELALADVGVSPEKLLTQELLSQDVAKFLAPLTPIQRQVLTLSFGLDNDQHFNLAQIGQQLNLSRERIRQIQVKAISILRHHQNDIQEYLFD